MKSRFSEKDSSSTLTEINLVQSVNESTYDFVVRLMNNQEKVQFLSMLLLLYRFLSLNKVLVIVMLPVSKKLFPAKIFRDAGTVLPRNQNLLIALFVDLMIIEILSIRMKVKKVDI